MRYKRGITLTTLIISIMVLLILAGATIIGIGNTIENARMTAFGNDLSNIEDAIDIYYIQNGEFPFLEENGEYIEYVYNTDKLSSNTDENISLNPKFINEFKLELIKNLDLADDENIVSDSLFYKIDLNKIDVKKISRGTGKDGNNDIFIMAYPSQNVYYIKGLESDGNIYFSLANITNVKKQQIVNNEVITKSQSGIVVTKEKKAWTNTLGINIVANIEPNERMYVKLPVRESEIALSTITGENKIMINSLDGSLGMTDEEIMNFNNLDISKKSINIIKKNDGIETANIQISLANYETEPPIFPLKEDGKTFDFTITSNDGYNKMSFMGKDKISGVKEVRYVYLTRFENNYIPKILYEDISILTPEYMLENGKKAYVSNTGNVEIKLPKDIEAIYITMYDKAGNSISMQKSIQTDTYIGIGIVDISNNIKFNIGIKSNLKIESAKASISLNGIDFIDEKELLLTKDSNNIYNSIIEFKNTQDKEVYIKVTSYDNSNPQIKDTRIRKFNLEEVASTLILSVRPGLIYEENRYYIDRSGDKAIIPAGFRVSSKLDEQTINDGLVVLDKADNEYVWIPCTVDGVNGSIKYEKWDGSKNTDYTVTKEQVSDDTLPNGVLNEKDQIEKYSGFYIARYEAGLPYEQTTEEMMFTKTFNATDNNRTDIGKAQSKSDKIVWNNINYNNAKIVSENVISNEYVQSGLITGTQWDTMLKFLSEEVDVDSNCISWGNYFNKYGYTINGYYKNKHADIAYTNGEYTKLNEGYLLLTTGKFGSVVREGSPKNIFDVAGNVWEWTAEAVREKSGKYTEVGNRILRGGSHSNYGSSIVASYRDGSGVATTTHPGNGFRIVLYIK